jgi:hypothetical protein
MKLTFEIAFPCMKCQQPFTDLDLTNSNYSLTILPTLILQHQTCPQTETNPNECEFTYLKTFEEKP